MDISKTIEPDSTQINADDLISTPITITVSDVTKGTAEQPVNIHSQEYPDRAYRPSKTMRRLIAFAWGSESSAYIGRRITLVRNPEITFGRDKVGGIEVSALSHIEKPLKIALTVARGKKRAFTVEPLPDAPPARDWVTESRQFTAVDDIRAHWIDAKAGGATPKQLADIAALANTISTPDPEDEP